VQLTTWVPPVLALAVLSCGPTAPDGFSTYTLDVSRITSTESGQPVTGTLIISHNAAAVFPLDLATPSKTLTTPGAATLVEVQTLLSCPTTTAAAEPWLRSGLVDVKDAADVSQVSLEMPYRARQDAFLRVPSSVCVGFYVTGSGWLWDGRQIAPVHDEARQRAHVDIDVDVRNVSRIAVLFNSTTSVEQIRYTAKPH
jgi:hypothetical protein